ncbi:MAG TPA: prolyl oligopeptidase family serine peptidase, partial [Ktedonobacteraceae bacterium]
PIPSHLDTSLDDERENHTMHIPLARRDDTVENYHGTLVADPYRWLENPAAADTLEWVEAQNAITEDYLASISARASLRDRMTALWNYPKYSVPSHEGEYYFYSKNDGLQNQGVLYRQESLQGPSSLVIDPNTLSEDGTTALVTQYYSKDGTLLVYGLSVHGSDLQELHIRQVESGAEYPEVIQWGRFPSVAWKRDKSGFFYNRLPEPGSVPPEDQSNYSQVYWHTLDMPQNDDRRVYERPDFKELSFSPFMSDDDEYLMLRVWHGTDPKNRFYYRKVESDGPIIRLLDDADASYEFVGNDGPIFYFQTTLDAPRKRIIAIDSEHPQRENWREVVPEQDDAIEFALMANHQFVSLYLHDAHHEIKIYRIDGRYERDIPLPAPGSIEQISGKPEQAEVFFSFTSFLYPSTIYRYDFTNSSLSLYHAPELDFDASAYETTQVFYNSKDGTRIPMFLTHKKGLKLDGSNPTLLYGYGGFDVSLTPSFSVPDLLWLEHGGVYAQANLRGGGEYGEEWHQAGTLERKQNVFDDFIAAAEWLIASKYTNSSRLAIWGGSNGGLLVAACMVQRPDLFGAVICQVPVIDMLRYHKFTVGRYWVSDFGNAEASAEHFKFMYAYSPLHNVKAGVAYPATLILAADTDDRVVPAHAKKFAATVQAAHTGDNPILLRIEMKAGHGMGKPTTKLIEERSDILAFLFERFGMV